jgi:DNA-binding transcriptional LysR family regulator
LSTPAASGQTVASPAAWTERARKLPTLDVRRLAVLREVAARGSFSAAARYLNYSQSAVSQQIAQLERDVGTVLVERRGRRIRLTPPGQRLADRAGLILRELLEAAAELEAASGQRRDPLRLALFASVAATLVPSALVGFRARYPDTVVAVALADSVAALSQLVNGEADIAVVNRPGAVDGDGELEIVDLLEDPMLVALPLGHLLAACRDVPLAQLRAEPWILATGSGCADWEVFATACRRAGFEPRVALRSDDYLALQGLVAAGLGVGLLPELAMASVRDDIVVRPLGPDGPVRHLTAVAYAGACQSPRVTAMLAALRESATARGAPARR